MKLKSIVLALGIAGAASAHATDYFLGDITGVVTPPTVIAHGVGAFTDFTFFSLSAPVIGSVTVADFPVAAPGGSYLYNVDGATFSLTMYQDLGTVGVADGGDVALFTLMGNYMHTDGPVAVGDYYFKVSGIATGSAGGIYTASAAALPVPEPDAYAMLLAGLGFVGTLARRRKQQ